MAEPTLSLQPGHYPGQHGAQVTITPPPGKSIVHTTDGSDPLLVRTVASTNLDGVEYPYVQTIDSGNYRAVFDGAFTKYNNTRWSEESIGQGERFFVNSLEFLRRRNSPNATPRLLVLGDMQAGDRGESTSYLVKDFTTPSSFGKFLTNCTQRAGWEIVIKDRGDYPDGELIPPMSELRQYDVIFFMSSYSWPTQNPPVAVTPEEGARNITNACREGIGLYICTDHGLFDLPYSGFFGNANRVIETLTNGHFYGSYDFAPGTTVEYNRNLHGDSLLFANMADTMIIGASGSDSYVKQPPMPISSEPVTITFDDSLDYATIKVAVFDPDPSIPLEKYIYGYVFSEHNPFFLINKDGDPITELEYIASDKRRGMFTYEPIDGMEPCNGYVKLGEHVITMITDHTDGPIQCTSDEHLHSDFRQDNDPNIYTMPRMWDLPLTLEITSPIKMTLSYPFNRNLEINREYDHIRAKWRGMIRQVHPMTENHPRSLQGVNNTYSRRFAAEGFFKDGNIHTDMRRYLTDPTASIKPTWIKKTDLIPYQVFYPNMATYGKFLFVLFETGTAAWVSSYESKTVLMRIDLETGERVEMIEGLPFARSQANLVPLSESRVLISGGLEPGFAAKLSDKVYVASVVSSTITDDKWFLIREVATHPLPAYKSGAIAYKDSVYFFGGQKIPDRASSTTDVCHKFTFDSVYTFDSGYWTSIQNLSKAGSSIGVALDEQSNTIFLAGGLAMVAPGSGVVSSTSATYFYSIEHDVFIPGPLLTKPLPTPFMLNHKYSALATERSSSSTPFQFLRVPVDGSAPYWEMTDIMLPEGLRGDAFNSSMTMGLTAYRGGVVVMAPRTPLVYDNPDIWIYAVR